MISSRYSISFLWNSRSSKRPRSSLGFNPTTIEVSKCVHCGTAVGPHTVFQPDQPVRVQCPLPLRLDHVIMGNNFSENPHLGLPPEPKYHVDDGSENSVEKLRL